MSTPVKKPGIGADGGPNKQPGTKGPSQTAEKYFGSEVDLSLIPMVIKPPLPPLIKLPAEIKREKALVEEKKHKSPTHISQSQPQVCTHLLIRIHTSQRKKCCQNEA